MKRPEKWREIKRFLFELHPSYVELDKDFCQAVKELRDVSNKTASSAKGTMRNTMKVPQYIYEALTAMDPEIMAESSGRMKGNQWKIGKELYNAFPEYRVARQY